ncbi:MAG: hypothetical protein V9F03_05355 [Microthrixaceae bacterium]
MSRVEFHAEFAQQFEALAMGDSDVFSDVAALILALETHGRLVEGFDHTADPSHPIVTSSCDMWALRRTPPTAFAPGAEAPPVLRIPYVWMIDKLTQHEYALVFFIGDKTIAGNSWYPAAIAKIEGSLLPMWEKEHPGHEARKRQRGPA